MYGYTLDITNRLNQRIPIRLHYNTVANTSLLPKAWTVSRLVVTKLIDSNYGSLKFTNPSHPFANPIRDTDGGGECHRIKVHTSYKCWRQLVVPKFTSDLMYSNSNGLSFGLVKDHSWPSVANVIMKIKMTKIHRRI